jgi:DNA-binding response OmpR family regulator
VGAELGLKILLVDDSVDFTQLLQMIVRELGHEVAVAHTSSQAVAQTKEFRPDLVFVDLYLPDRPGVRLARLLRRFGAAGMNIVGLSGCSPEEATKEISGSCIAFCLQKPLGLGILRKTVQNAIAQVEANVTNLPQNSRPRSFEWQDQVQGQ